MLPQAGVAKNTTTWESSKPDKTNETKGYLL